MLHENADWRDRPVRGQAQAGQSPTPSHSGNYAPTGGSQRLTGGPGGARLYQSFLH